MSKTIIIIGAGLAGLSAVLQAAENGCNVKLVSSLPSERAQSVMAEGGINAALNTKDENDSPEEHFTDTIKAACGLADPNAVWGMTQAAPELVHWLLKLGVKFNMSGYDDVDLRNFGGQKKKRTAFAQSDTGKQIMTAMIDAVRRKEASGMVERFSHHSFLTLRLCGNICCGCVIRDEYSQETVELPGDAVIVATGGMHGLFGNTTGSLSNTGEVTAELFRLGVPLANGEMIQYHPTTVKCGGKRMLISEAAREMTKKLGSIAERTGCAIVLIGHMNKGSGAKAAYRGMGSIDFFAVARSVMLVGRIEGQSNLRAMIQIKNNLAAFGHPKAFELAEDGFHWLGDYEITADEVLGGMVPKASKLEMAKQFLREQAERTQRILSTEIIELAAQEGISKRTLETAKKELKIKAERCNNNWYWNLRA